MCPICACSTPSTKTIHYIAQQQSTHYLYHQCYYYTYRVRWSPVSQEACDLSFPDDTVILYVMI